MIQIYDTTKIIYLNIIFLYKKIILYKKVFYMIGYFKIKRFSL